MESGDSQPGLDKLTGSNALHADVDQPWEQDNQAWWDWYVSLGDEEIEEERRPSQVAIESANALLERELAGAECASDDELARELERPYGLGRDQLVFFRENGYIKLPGVLSHRTIFRLRAEMLHSFVRSFGLNPDREASDRFLSLELEWLANPVIRRFVLSPRIARLCGQLLGVDAVRLYHDNLLAKQPGCGRTPWHYDHHHFPLDTDDVVTAWIPAQSIPAAMGPLAFAGPIDAHEHVAGIRFDKFGTTFDQQVEQAFRRLRREIFIEDGPFETGEVSFHHNLCFHSAGSNHTRYSRMALANTYFTSGARVVENPTMVSGDWQKFMPGTRPGGTADSERNPVCWSRQTYDAQTG